MKNCALPSKRMPGFLKGRYLVSSLGKANLLGGVSWLINWTLEFFLTHFKKPGDVSFFSILKKSLWWEQSFHSNKLILQIKVSVILSFWPTTVSFKTDLLDSFLITTNCIKYTYSTVKYICMYIRNSTLKGLSHKN